jgi:glycosyltransferase involved in cell wall biosynthesis
VYVAHTSLEAELPVYFPSPLAPFLRRAGGSLERALCRRSERVLAVSPLLAHMLTVQSGVSAHALPLPWHVPPHISPDERQKARAALGLHERELVLLYAGNLDAYQGLEAWLSALASFAREAPFTWLVASEADPTRFSRTLANAGLARRTAFVPLQGEAARRKVHAAADVALVPRHSPGGIPIKLFDAIARGVPVLASARASAGTELVRHCRVVRDDDPEHLVHMLRAFIQEPEEERRERAEAGRSYLVREHSPAAFVRAFGALMP